MGGYSPQAQELLERWNCLSLNMRSAIFRARWLQRRAEQTGRQQELLAQLQKKRVNALYREIGRQMRTFSMSEGVERQIPEDPQAEPGTVGRFLDFRIREEAIPQLNLQLDRLGGMVLTLLITLCSIRL